MPFADISVSDKYAEMVADARIRKRKINAREFFQTLRRSSSNPAIRT